MFWTFWRRKRGTLFTRLVMQMEDSSSRSLVTSACVCPTQTRSNLLHSTTFKVRYWLRKCMILINTWAGDIDSSGTRSPVTEQEASFICHMTSLGPKWLRTFAIGPYPEPVQTSSHLRKLFFSRTVSAFTARIWMRLPLIYFKICIILAATEQYCVMSNNYEDFY